MKKWLIIIGVVLLVLIVAVVIYFNVAFISKKEVKNIVLEHAGLKETDVQRWQAELNHEDTGWEYEVEYVYDNEEYNYELDAKTGDIILYGIDK